MTFLDGNCFRTHLCPTALPSTRKDGRAVKYVMLGCDILESREGVPLVESIVHSCDIGCKRCQRYTYEHSTKLTESIDRIQQIHENAAFLVLQKCGESNFVLAKSSTIHNIMWAHHTNHPAE